MASENTKTINGVTISTMVWRADEYPFIDVPEGTMVGNVRFRTDWYDKARYPVFIDTNSPEVAHKMLQKIAMKDHRKLVKQRERAAQKG
jgi:hypothetical protein